MNDDDHDGDDDGGDDHDGDDDDGDYDEDGLGVSVCASCLQCIRWSRTKLGHPAGGILVARW